MHAGVVSYADLDHQVTLRSRSLAREVTAGEVLTAPVHLDLASVVEVFAIMRAGAVVAPYGSVPPPIRGPAPQGTALCIATSGSTGAPRIVPLSYVNLAASVAASRNRLENGPDDRWLATLPLHHIGGLSVLLRSFEAGGTVILTPFGTDTASVIDRAAPTIASLVPTMVHRLLEDDPDSLAAIGIVLAGGARLSRQLVARAIASGVRLLPTYGMTETASQIATAVPGSPLATGDVVGPPLDGFSVSIRTPEGLAQRGEVGVIEVEGPAVFNGYLGSTPRAGAYRTSDLGFVDDAGSLGVIGRIDDVVMTGGENVSLSRVASAIEVLPGVRDVVVVGVPDPEWGTTICALIDVEPGSHLGAVLDGLSPSLPKFAMPKRVVSGGVPLLGNGKHDISAVQRHFTAG
jgi:O-succinylbenzoic acid--CoA ligase